LWLFCFAWPSSLLRRVVAIVLFVVECKMTVEFLMELETSETGRRARAVRAQLSAPVDSQDFHFKIAPCHLASTPRSSAFNQLWLWAQ